MALDLEHRAIERLKLAAQMFGTPARKWNGGRTNMNETIYRLERVQKGEPFSILYPSDIDDALCALRAQSEDNPPLTEEHFEAICEAVHNGWWEEKKRQGVTDHPDMKPYEELTEEVKEYDRVTVRRVIDAMGVACRRRPEGRDAE